MYNKKLCLITTMLIASTMVLFSGCGKNDTESVTSEAVEETEPTAEIEEIEESDQGTNEGTAIDRETNSSENTSETNGSDVEINGEAVGNTALTQEEIDALKAQASSDAEKTSLEAYESISNGGTWKGPGGGTYDKVVGTPGDTSWRRMSDEEANAIISKGKPDPFENPDEAYEYQTAEAELSAGTWSAKYVDTIYFDYYAYQEARDKANKEWREAHADEGLDDGIDDTPIGIENW